MRWKVMVVKVVAPGDRTSGGIESIMVRANGMIRWQVMQVMEIGGGMGWRYGGLHWNGIGMVVQFTDRKLHDVTSHENYVKNHVAMNHDEIPHTHKYDIYMCMRVIANKKHTNDSQVCKHPANL